MSERASAREKAAVYLGAMPNAPSKVRITIDLTAELDARLEKLTSSLSESSKADTVRYALRVLEFLVGRYADGYRFSEEKDGERQDLEIFVDRPRLSLVR